MQVEKLTDTTWDVIISGTGLPQSLLALSLSRTGKKVLHVDKQSYYGGSEAAFSLQEAEEWVKTISEEPGSMPFESASIHLPSAEGDNQLSFSRAYTLSLAPQLLYSRSRLLPSLVSSKVYRQLEFQAVGSWWVCKPTTGVAGSSADQSHPTSLHRVPSSREDVFADEEMTMKSKRTLMKFLRHLTQQQDDADAEDQNLESPFSQFLESNFHMSPELSDPLLSLSLSPNSLEGTSTGYALSRIKRHLGSIGVFGAGFGSVLAKWGGAAEISQIGCRACAVGGGVYVLGRGIKQIEKPTQESERGKTDLLQVQLSDDEVVCSRFVVGSPWDLPANSTKESTSSIAKVARSITIVSSALDTLFPPTSEGGPVPAGAVVFLPSSMLNSLSHRSTSPVYLIVHSSDTGECPTGQCVIYASVSLPGNEGQTLLEAAVKHLISSVDAKGQILWSLRYTQLGLPGDKDVPNDHLEGALPQVMSFPPPSLDLAFDDSMVDQVRYTWRKVVDEEVDDATFLEFEDREAIGDENE
ncbi:hypothetical protein AJ80_01892 [Polytolypa hystricis UAMH7299]|uniref:Rab proteins geranylgeranyltransferase n=1 Tax=Polytolypa hystricis (strain UAMH7299) TaxID=1447883 RepID=A0A2B7YQV7_POLH7|nr:hypothetical protein AJ80_01892 [Polytolypa hystricis UAMH7299]